MNYTYNYCQPSYTCPVYVSTPCPTPCPTPVPPPVTIIVPPLPIERAALILGTATEQEIPNNVGGGASTAFPFTILTIWGPDADGDVNQFDNGTIIHDPVTGYFTITRTGIYSISAYITWDPSTVGTREMWINRLPVGVVAPPDQFNTQVLAADSRTGTDTPTRVTLTTDAYLLAGDRVFVSVWQNSGTPLTVADQDFEQGNKIAIVQLI